MSSRKTGCFAWTVRVLHECIVIVPANGPVVFPQGQAHLVVTRFQRGERQRDLGGTPLLRGGAVYFKRGDRRGFPVLFGDHFHVAGQIAADPVSGVMHGEGPRRGAAGEQVARKQQVVRMQRRKQRLIPERRRRQPRIAEPRREAGEMRIEPVKLEDPPSVPYLRPAREVGADRLEERNAAGEADAVRIGPVGRAGRILQIVPEETGPEFRVGIDTPRETDVLP